MKNGLKRKGRKGPGRISGDWALRIVKQKGPGKGKKKEVERREEREK